MRQCQTCGGIYVEVFPDGTRYFHACPPLMVQEVRAALAAGTPVLSPAQLNRLTQLDKLPAPAVPAATYVAPGDLYLQSLVVERPNKRDENIDPAKIAAAPRDEFGNVLKSVTADQLMKSVGLGALAINDAAV